MFNPASVPVQPISSLTPFLGGKQWIKARVSDKTDVRTWNKPTSNGKLFSCTLVDDTASIRATFFNDGVDQFYDVLQNGQVYYIGGGSVKNANRRYSNVTNEYELSLDKDAQVHLARDAASNIPMHRYYFVPINVLQSKEDGSPIDVLAVVLNVSPPVKINTKEGKELMKRDVTVADSSASVDITFWGDTATSFNCDAGAVIALRNVKMRQYNGGVTLSFGQQSGLDVNPKVSDTEKLQRWYQTTGGGLNVKSLTAQRSAEGGNNLGFRYFRQIDTEGLGKGDKADFVQVRCVPVFIKTESVFYDACPKCNKKVIATGDIMRCEKCNTAVTPVARYLSSVECSDGVTSKWLTLFNEAGETFFNCPANTLKMEAARGNSMELANRARARLHKPLIMTIRVKEESGQTAPDGTPLENRVRLTVTRVEDFLFPAENGALLLTECQRLIETIKSYHI